jgi:hypothetical protein
VTDFVRNEEVLQRVEEERNVLHTIKRRKVNCTGHFLRRNYLVKHVNEGRYKGQENEEKEVSCYKMNLRKDEDTGN